MPRKPTITTLWTAAWRESNVNRTCPGEHLLPHRADVHYVITRQVDDDDRRGLPGRARPPAEAGTGGGCRAGADEPGGYLISTLVTDAERAGGVR